MATLNGTKVPIAVEYLVCRLHCHERTAFSKAENKDFVMNELELIKEGKDDGSLQEKHARWQRNAVENGGGVTEDMVDHEAVKRYACQRPQVSGREIAEMSGQQISPEAVDMVRMREN